MVFDCRFFVIAYHYVIINNVSYSYSITSSSALVLVEVVIAELLDDMFWVILEYTSINSVWKKLRVRKLFDNNTSCRHQSKERILWLSEFIHSVTGSTSSEQDRSVYCLSLGLILLERETKSWLLQCPDVMADCNKVIWLIINR